MLAVNNSPAGAVGAAATGAAAETVVVDGDGSPRRLADCIMIWSTWEARSACADDDPGATVPPAGAATTVTETVDDVGVVEDDEDAMAENGTAGIGEKERKFWLRDLCGGDALLTGFKLRALFMDATARSAATARSSVRAVASCWWPAAAPCRDGCHMSSFLAAEPAHVRRPRGAWPPTTTNRCARATSVLTYLHCVELHANPCKILRECVRSRAFYRAQCLFGNTRKIVKKRR